jgi:xanthine dehydrogenase YagR molybdenum-binding subunit
MESVGKPLDRVDGRLKVTGGARYAAEFALPGLVHGALIQSPFAAGTITGIDDAAARKAPGVLAVITFQNAPKVGVPASRPSWLVQPIFGGPTVEYSGQHLGIVVADTLERARHAASLVKFRFDARTPRVEMEKHRDEGFAPKVFDPARFAPTKRGDLSAGRAAAQTFFEATYGTPTEHHNPLEPHASIATWDDGKLTVYDATQGANACRQTLAETFNLPVEDVRVISPFVGGGFGSKGTMWMHVPIAALAARQVGRPVKLVLRRQEMFSGHGHRAQTEQRMEMGVDAAHKLTMTRHDVVNETSMREEVTEAAAYMTGMMYGCDNLESSYKVVRVHKMPPTFMRAPGEASGSFALECAMDELALKLGLDPIEFRLLNDTNFDGTEKLEFSSRALAQCLRSGAEKFGWNERAQTPGAKRQGRYAIGYGVASAVYPANLRPCTARAIITPTGQVTIQTASHDLGTGAYTIFTQVAADALGVPVERVRVELGDTKLPEGVLAGGSSTSASAGSAIMDACETLKKRLVSLAISNESTPLVGLALSEVKAENGRVFAVANAGRGLSYEDVLKLSGQEKAEGMGNNGKAQREKKSYHSFGAHFCRVRVDTELGQVRIEKMLGIYGGGKILNLKTARSQMLGGMIWGIGMALHEETMYDPHTGRCVTRNLADYHIPSCADSPEIEVEFVPEDDTLVSPIGAKGIGELGIVGAAAAIANAIYNATGKRVRHLPILPDKLV